MTAIVGHHRQVLAQACALAGLDPTGAEPIRTGENAIFRLHGGVVARIARPGRLDVARREIEAARWLAHHHLPATQPVDGLPQPVDVDGWAVTFWEALPPHHHGTPAAVATLLRRLHDLPVPDHPAFPVLDPFARLDERIDAATTLDRPDRQWLREHRAELFERALTWSSSCPGSWAAPWPRTASWCGPRPPAPRCGPSPPSAAA